MRTMEEICAEIQACDKEIAKLLAKRMHDIRESVNDKKEQGLPILQSELSESGFEGVPCTEETKEIFDAIHRMSKKVQAQELLPCNIALIGFMGAGKSTVARYLKERLALDVVETDARIVETEGMEIKDIFAKYGEEYFRKCESNTVIELQNRSRTIISCGGGLVMRDENVKNLKKSSRIVLLTAAPETIYERVKDSDERPILNGNMNVAYIEQLMEKRRARYEAAADLVIHTDGKSIPEICEELIRRIC